MINKKILVASILSMLTVPGARAVIVSETMLSKNAGVFDKDYTVEMAINDVQSSVDTTNTAISNLDGKLSTNDVSGGNVVTEVTQQDGLVTVTHGKAVNAVAAATGSGNVVTGVTLNSDGKTINVAKGSTAVLTSGDQSIAGTKTFTGTVSVTGTAKVTGANTTAGKDETGTAVAAVTDGNVKNAVLALDKKKEEVANKVKVEDANFLSEGQKNSTTMYPSMATVTGMLNGANEYLTGQIGNKQDKQIGAKKVNGADSTDSGNAVIVGTDGKITMGKKLGDLAYESAVVSDFITDGTIVDADISESANITGTKVNAATNNVRGTVLLASGSTTNTTAENVSNKVTSVTSSSNDTQYPSAKAVYSAVNTAAGAKVSTAQGSTNANKTMITNASGSIVPVAITNSGSGVVTGISVGDGKFTVTKSAVNANSLADKGVTANKLADSVIVAGTNTTVSRNATDATTDPGAYKVNVATANGSTLGVVKAGTNVSISSGAVSVADASTSAKGVMKLQTGTGSGTDGTMTQKAITDALATKQNLLLALPTALPVSNPDGVYVLTAKKDGTSVVYSWEDIGR